MTFLLIFTLCMLKIYFNDNFTGNEWQENQLK